MEINGIAHTFVTVGDFDRARAFYSKLLPFLGLQIVMDVPGTYYCVGGRTGFAIREATEPTPGDRFDQNRVGLHHICFRARSRAPGSSPCRLYTSDAADEDNNE